MEQAVGLFFDRPGKEFGIYLLDYIMVDIGILLLHLFKEI
jgi:hypothetical protein